MAVHHTIPALTPCGSKDNAFFHSDIAKPVPSFLSLIAKRKRNACLRTRLDETIYNIKLNILSINQLIY